MKNEKKIKICTIEYYEENGKIKNNFFASALSGIMLLGLGRRAFTSGTNSLVEHY
jgi:hypothetical protein